MRRFVIFLLLFVFLAMLPLSAGIFQSKEGKFALSPAVDWTLSASSVALLGTDFLIAKKLRVKSQAYSGGMLDKNEVNPFDRWAMPSSYSKSMDIASQVFQYAALLSPVILAATPTTEWGTIAVMYAETVLATYGISEMVKGLVDRNRPYLYTGDYAIATDDGDWKSSFFSGHTSRAFAGATFLSYVFCTYYPDSGWKYPVVIGSYALAATTAALRVTSGKHYLSDVLAGAAVGSLIGFLVPYLHTFEAKRQKEGDKTASFSLLPNGVSCTIALR